VRGSEAPFSAGALFRTVTATDDDDWPLAVGTAAVTLARRSVEEALAARREPGVGPLLPPIFREPRGVFVTLRRYPGDLLRGCIGFPRPVHPLDRAVREAAVAAALDDPRFPPVRSPELPRLTFEVSLLSLPELLRREPDASLPERIRIGRDGLIVEGFGQSGLLLPQVAPELGWGAEQLLDGTCEKAGLPAGAWRDPRVTVRRFGAAVFAERSPAGPVARADLTGPRRDAPPAPKS